MPGFSDDHVDPDPAALDELSRAFGGRDAEGERAGPSSDAGLEGPAAIEQESTAAATPTWLEDEDEFGLPEDVDRADEPADIVIIEQDPLPDPTPAPPPTIIRIDDYSGSRVMEPVEVIEPSITPVEGPTRASSQDATPEHVGSGAIEATEAVESGTTPGEPMVIAIDDADLPDAVYVEGSLDRDGSRSIVLIEDDDTGDAMQPEAERDLRRGIEPRLRERRVAVKRAAGRKRLKWVALVVLIVLLVVGVLATLGSPLFAVREDQVLVTGNVYTDPERLQAVIDDLVGTPVLRVDTQDAEAQLEAIPWVDTARVRTEFPHAVTVEIKERQAMTTYQGPDGRYRVLDREGRVLDVLVNYPFAYLLIGGEDAQDLDAGQFAPIGYAAASELAKNLTPRIRGQISFVEVRADGSQLDLLLDNGTRIRFGEARDFFAKLIRVEAILAEGDLDGTEVIDVSTNEVTR
jgi:cell division protein FtsQ